MGYPALLLLLAFGLTIPFALWIRRRARQGKSRTPERSIVLTFVIILAVILTFSALDGYFYPYGWPGSEVPGLRASAIACARAYGDATTPAESAHVDTMFLPPSPDTVVPSCGMLRQARLPGCEPGSRCAWLRASLNLPGS